MSLADWLRVNFEPLQYLAFFGSLAAIAAIESIAPLLRVPGTRRRRWPANFTLTALNIAIVSALPVSGLFVADLARASGTGLFAFLGLPGALAIAVGMAARSLGNYLVHVAMHKIPVLWRLHRVHHSDTDFDISTAVRFHPIEFLVQVPVALAVIWVLGIPPLAIILYELLDAAMAAWTHANMRVPAWLDRSLRLVLVTPDMHRIHHSTRPVETDSNYGATFSVWDRAFGTMCHKTESELAAMRLGLKECQDLRSSSFWWLLKLPFLRLLVLDGERRQG